MNALDSLTNKQIDAIINKVQSYIYENNHLFSGMSSLLTLSRGICDLFPKTTPVMVPLEDVLPLLRAAENQWPNVSRVQAGYFRAKHADKLNPDALNDIRVPHGERDE